MRLTQLNQLNKVMDNTAHNELLLAGPGARISFKII